MSLRHVTNLFGHKLHTLPLLVLYLTDGCNSRCAMCDIWRNPRRNMDPALVDSLLASAQQMNVRWLLLSGGEATQHPQWAAIARRFRDAGIYVMLLTNALHLERQAAATADAVDEVIVSLDAGTAPTYREIRGVDGLRRVLAGVRAVRERGVAVTTRTTVQRQNYAELPQIIEAGLAADANAISFLAVDVSSEVAFGDRVANPQSPALAPADVDAFAAVLDRVARDYAPAFASGRIAETPAKLRRMVRYFRAVNGEVGFAGPRCNAPHVSTVVEVDGRVRPCYFLPEVGRVDATTDLQSVLNGPAGVAMRAAYQRGERPECARCVCPLYKGPRALARL